MKEDTKSKPAEAQPNDPQGNDEALSPKQLDEISGGRKSNDPCEGGQAV